MFRLFCIFSLTLFLQTVCGQNKLSYPQGLTVDPEMESLCKKNKRDINSFTIVHYINDSISSQPLLNSLSGLPLTSLTTLNVKDTTFTFIGTLIPWGFQITLRETNPEIVTFVSSRSCKCYKDDLSKSDFSYGAGAKSTSQTIVFNKINNIKIGDIIYGYIKVKGGDIYHSSDNHQEVEKWNFQYEGFFSVEFRPVNQ